MRPFDRLAFALRFTVVATVLLAVLWAASTVAVAEINLCGLGRSYNVALVGGSFYVEYPWLSTDEIGVSGRVELTSFEWLSKKYLQGGTRVLGFSVRQSGSNTYLVGVPLWPAILSGVVGCALLIRARRRRLIPAKRDL